MKSIVSLFLAGLAVASPLSLSDQVPLGLEHEYPGFDLDLNAQRLVQLDGRPPVWMSELEKVGNFRSLFDRGILCFHRSKRKQQASSSSTCDVLSIYSRCADY